MPLLSTAVLGSGELAQRTDVAEDRALAERAQAGDERALREIYDRFAPSVMRFVRDMVRDPHAAADAHQDTFIRVFHRMPSLEDPARLVGFVFGIARRVCLEHRRKATRGKHLEPAESGLDIADLAAGPEIELSGVESAAALDRAIDALPAERRAILLLRCDHLLPYEEIAVATGFSVAKVKVEVHRARLALRKVLDEATPDDGAGRGGAP
ncbi:MAG TPA: RNA polymerase sigma factor [Polyangiaceae bacterium]|nr:RNA polymerase sigma factor [Polyangiaceae bacterium]